MDLAPAIRSGNSLHPFLSSGIAGKVLASTPIHDNQQFLIAFPLRGIRTMQQMLSSTVDVASGKRCWLFMYSPKRNYDGGK